LKLFLKYGDWGLGIGDWGLGIGDWAQSPIPNPQSPHIYLDGSKEPTSISLNNLKSTINETTYIVSTQEVRLFLTGINLKKVELC